MAQSLKKLAVVYQRIEERQNLNNSCYQKFDKEGSDLNSALSQVEFFKAKQGQNVPKRDESNLETLLIDLFHCKV